MSRSILPTRRQGRLIVFEGPDESGKTTISKQVAATLNSRGQKCIWLAFPGHEPHSLGAEIYSLHHDPRFGDAPPLSLQLLHIAAHVESIQRRILPALKAGTWVVLDRFWWSALAYGLAAKVEPKALNLALQVEQLQWGRVRPSIAFLFVRDLPNLKKQPSGRVRLQHIYQQIARREKCRHSVQIVQNNSTLEEVCTLVTDIVGKMPPTLR